MVFTLLPSSAGTRLYSVSWDPSDIPPPTPRFRRFALHCGIFFLNSLTFNAFAREARAQFALPG